MLKAYSDSISDLYEGHAPDILAELPEESVQCCVTSPPYWGLRSYNGNQIIPSWECAYGLEPTPELYVQHTVEILEAIKRVLRKDGVCFWNIGDSYASGKGTCFNPGGGDNSIEGHAHLKDAQAYPLDRGNKSNLEASHLKPKDLCLIPFRVAIAAQEAGWWVRSVIIWSKNNPMPESVTDRPTESHEYILMLTKSANYYWDQEAVRERQTESSIERAKYAWHGRTDDESNGARTGSSFIHMANGDGLIETIPSDGYRNLRSVWTFPTQPFKGAHFATFPEELPRRCIKAATPEAGCCPKCGTPWERMIESDNYTRTRKIGEGQNTSIGTKGRAGEIETKTLGWRPGCSCGITDKVPSIVLDPFAGSGTTLAVAKSLGRRSIGIDLSEKYLELSRRRVESQTAPMI